MLPPGPAATGLSTRGFGLSPIVIEAIGDSHSLAEGARFRGGLVSQVESQKVAGSVAIEELPEVEITSLHQPRAPRYAQPA